MQNTLSSNDLAKKAADDVLRSTQPEQNEAEDILNSLQIHYAIINKTQEMQIEFLSEFIKNLKTLQNKDKESLDNLKKKILSHVLNK